MENTISLEPFLFIGAIIVLVTWFFFGISNYILAYKHDSYIKKKFPELYKVETVSPFGGNWNGIRSLRNIFSSESAPDEYISIMRRKIRYCLYGMFLSLSLLPMGLFFLLVIYMALKNY